MFERFVTDVRSTVMVAAQDAVSRRGDRRIGSDHLLIGVVTAGNQFALDAGLTVESLFEALQRLDERALGAIGLAASGGPGGHHRRRRHLPFTRGAKNALERSLRIAADLGHRRITTDHLLAALAVGGAKDAAVQLISACGLEPAALDLAVRQRWSREE